MRIDSSYNTKIILDKTISLKKGSIITGEILTLGKDEITIKLNDGNILNAKLNGDILLNENDRISLIVKETTKNTIIMSLFKPDNEFIDSDTTNYSKSSDITSLINKNMIKYDLNLNNYTFNKLFNYLNKLTTVLNTSKDEILYSENNINADDISKIIIKDLSNLNVSINELDKLIEQTKIYKNEVYNIFTSKEKMLERITFLFSNNLEVSYKNIKLIHEFENNNNFLFEEIIDLIKEFDNKNNLNKDINSLVNNKEVNKLNKELESIFKSIYDNIDKIKSDKNKSENLEVFHSKLKFLEKLGSNFIINFIPINFIKEENLLIVKNIKEKNKRFEKNISFKISIDTKNLGLINIFCKLSHNNLSVDINVENNKAYELIKDNIKLLSEYLQIEGFINNIRIHKELKNTSLDLFVITNDLDLSLDIKV